MSHEKPVHCGHTCIPRLCAQDGRTPCYCCDSCMELCKAKGEETVRGPESALLGPTTRRDIKMALAEQRIDCETPRCADPYHAIGPDGLRRCLPCLRAYRDGMAQVVQMDPREVDSSLAALEKLLGPREELERAPIAEVRVRDVIVAVAKPVVGKPYVCLQCENGAHGHCQAARGTDCCCRLRADHVDISEERRCLNRRCDTVLPPDHPAVYCSNSCALDDA